jgi:hypothetical protein
MVTLVAEHSSETCPRCRRTGFWGVVRVVDMQGILVISRLCPLNIIVMVLEVGYSYRGK